MKRMVAVILAAAATVGCTSRHTPTPPSEVLYPVPTPPVATQPAVPMVTAVPVATQPSVQTPVKLVEPRVQIVQPTPPVIPAQPAIASVNGVEISRERVVQTVMETHGLNALMSIVQLELAKQLATRENLKVSPDDLRKEQALTVSKMFKEANQKLVDQIADAELAGKTDDALGLREQLQRENDTLLEQFLTKQLLTHAEFNLLMETNAYIRKVVELQIRGKITDDNLREAYMMLYGENVRVRHIECANLQEVADVQRRLAAGEAFDRVARELSRNAGTRELGGELPPFSRETPNLPQSFRDVAFTLKAPGEISDPVEANGSYHLIKLIARVAPKAVKFAAVKESVREIVYDRWLTEQIKAVRARLGQEALKSLQISDPVLGKQFQDLMVKHDAEMKDRDQISRELSRQREIEAARAIAAATRPTTLPMIAPTPVEPPRPPVSPTVAPASAATSKPAALPTIAPTPAKPPRPPVLPTVAPASAAASRPAALPTLPPASAEAPRPPATKSGSDTPDQPPATSPTSQP